ncbi:unnamed protein product [Musa acuminata subsp. malaccensis]|uniref:(wild Malaysian banana) hypothetical protein n=1 Tax=Musa acuminata subsp. malaccensis TaxID=214687 RepID=A0A8D6ZUX4_MUSAM|nr:unnamed protein product [Musa acuminata subsp. malaccensis]
MSLSITRNLKVPSKKSIQHIMIVEKMINDREQIFSRCIAYLMVRNIL